MSAVYHCKRRLLISPSFSFCGLAFLGGKREGGTETECQVSRQNREGFIVPASVQPTEWGRFAAVSKKIPSLFVWQHSHGGRRKRSWTKDGGGKGPTWKSREEKGEERKTGSATQRRFFSIALDDDSEEEVEGSRQPSLTSSGCGIGL